MEHLDSLITSLTPEEINYLRNALDAIEAPDRSDEGEEIPTSIEDEE